MAYQQLTERERFYIEQRLSLGERIPDIAKALGRHKTSLYREIKRNTDETFNGLYCHRRAVTLAEARKRDIVRKRPLFDTMLPEVRIVLFQWLSERMSPEQISGNLRSEFNISLSHQTIYRFLWEDRKQGGELYQHLRRRGKKYRKNGLATQTKVGGKVNISVRAPIEQLRQKAGHFEADTIFGADQKSFLLTLVDLATKYTIVVKLDNKEANTVYIALKYIVENSLIPFRSITTDNGCEFALHETFTKDTSISWYFCDPYCSWQRGLNENTNGLIRDFYPKRTDFREVSEADILKVQNILNNRPRKTLGFMTPTQAMAQQVHGQKINI